jgi:hypothetical protein
VREVKRVLVVMGSSPFFQFVSLVDTIEGALNEGALFRQNFVKNLDFDNLTNVLAPIIFDIIDAAWN